MAKLIFNHNFFIKDRKKTKFQKMDNLFAFGTKILSLRNWLTFLLDQILIFLILMEKISRDFHFKALNFAYFSIKIDQKYF